MCLFTTQVNRAKGGGIPCNHGSGSHHRWRTGDTYLVWCLSCANGRTKRPCAGGLLASTYSVSRLQDRTPLHY